MAVHSIALGLLIVFTIWKSSLLVFTHSDSMFHDVDIHAGGTDIGRVTWWKCEGPDIDPDLECGHIMYDLIHCNLIRRVCF